MDKLADVTESFAPRAPAVADIIIIIITQFDTYLADWQVAHGPLSPSDPLPVKQSVWDKPGILSSSASVESAISDSCQKARFLAAAAPHSGDWLLALPVTSCGLRMTDEAVRVAVALRLGCSVCVAHTCRCVALVDAQGIHGSVCKQAPSKIARHQATSMTSLPVL